MMTTTDRRSGQDRREAERFKLSVEVQWENMFGRRSGSLSDISVKGCFILGTGEIHDGEIVRIFLPLSDGTNVEILGDVSNHVFEIGFAARFVDLTASQNDFLENFVTMHRRS